MSEGLNLESMVADHIAGIPRSGIRDFFELVQGREGVISLGVGEPDFCTPWHIREAAIYSLEQGQTSYTSNLGSPRLRKAISKYVDDFFGVRYNDADEIIVTVGVSEAIDLALRALLNPGDEVIYHEPCYVSYSPSIGMAFGVPKPVQTFVEDGFSLRAEEIEKVITPRSKVLMLNFPTNPTGASLDPVEMEKIAELCKKHNLIVITDEIYSELRYSSEPHQSIVTLPGMRERTILLHGFSKAFAMTGFRLGYACGPTVLIEAMMKIHQYAALCASITSQAAAVEALENGAPAVEQMRRSYDQRRQYMVRTLNQLGLPTCDPGGGFYVFPDIRGTGLTSSEFATKLLEAENVAAVPGDAFGAAGSGFLRCCYATSFDELREAMTRMGRFLKSIGVDPVEPVADESPVAAG